MGLLIVFSVSLISAHLVFAYLIATFAVAGTFAVMTVEPLIDKTAFPES